ncbi:hypothetical protein SK128_014603, partial [Halocaridina rubra]
QHLTPKHQNSYFIKECNIPIAFLKEAKLHTTHKTPISHNFKTIRQDRICGGGIVPITLVHKSFQLNRHQCT